MFISSLAGIGIGITLGMLNNLILHHVLPDHVHPVEDEGMLATSLAILRRRFNGNTQNADRQDAESDEAGQIPRLLPPPDYRELANEN